MNLISLYYRLIPDFLYNLKMMGFSEYRSAAISCANGKTLEIGVGTGLNQLRNAVVIDNQFKYVRSLDNAAVMDGTCLGFKDNCFDSVLMTFTYSSIHNKRALLSETKRVLQPDGQVIILDLFTRKQVFHGYRIVKETEFKFRSLEHEGKRLILYVIGN